MFNLDEFMAIIEGVSPLSLSHKMIEKGSYDNSGLLVKSTEKIEKILFSLDLSLEVVNKAIELKCDTIVTHHPAIYQPLKSLSITGETAPIVLAIKNQINVISMHLNLDIADDGIEYAFTYNVIIDNVTYGLITELNNEIIADLISTFNA